MINSKLTVRGVIYSFIELSSTETLIRIELPGKEESSMATTIVSVEQAEAIFLNIVRAINVDKVEDNL